MDKFCKIISILFSPLAVPTYAIALLTSTSYLVLLPASVRWIIVAAIAVMTAVIPLGALMLMKRLRMVADLDVSNRRERAWAVPPILLCYLMAYALLIALSMPGLVLRMWIGAMVATACVFAISFFWKISGHATAMGALAAIAWVEFTKMLTVSNLFIIFAVIVLLLGIVGSARVHLRKHTVAQVLAGALLGGASVLLLTL